MHEATLERFKELDQRGVPLHRIPDAADEVERIKASLETNALIAQQLDEIVESALERCINDGR